MERIIDVLRSFPKNTEDLTAVPDDIEELSIARDTRGIDRLDRLSRVRRLWIGGATPGSLESVSQLSRLEELVIAAASGALPASWHLPKLRTLLLTRCTRITSVESLAAMGGLESLGITGAKRLIEYTSLGILERLKMLELGIEQYYERQSINSLDFLPNLKQLEILTLRFSAVADGLLLPITKLPKLQKLNISNTFAREQFAYLVAKLPTVTCRWFAGFTPLGKCSKCGENTSVMLTGKGQPRLCTVCDAKRFTTKVAEFHSLVASHR